MNKALFSALLTVTMISTATFSVNATETASKLSGKDFVSMGKLGALSGSLFEQNGEWYLRSNNETYELHIGNHTYRDETGIKLKADASVDVSGFIHEKDVSVVTINIDGKEYRFRNDDGRPMWAGRGNGRNRMDGRGNGNGNGNKNGSGRDYK